MKPSDFTIRPWNSVLNNMECEFIACNIMIILARTGNIFHSLDWNKYRTERLKDGNFIEKEKTYFNKVKGYCLNEHSAKLFSDTWASVEN